jgi:nucleotide-binding universal stress UspA family protein
MCIEISNGPSYCQRPECVVASNQGEKMKILLTTDGSGYSEEAARFITRFSFTPKDEIIVLHVVSEIPYDDDHHAKIKRLIKKTAPHILDSSIRILGDLKAKIRGMEEDGYPDTTIVKLAVDLDVDLVVTGASGVSGLQSLFLGSTARAVAINSPRPVLVVKHKPWEEGEKFRVLLASDGSDVSFATAGQMALLPFPDNTEIIIMNVSWSAFSDLPERFAMEISDRLKEDVARAKAIESRNSEDIIEKTRSHLSGRFAGIEEVVRVGDPSEEILHQAAKSEADIVAVGCRGLKGIRGMMGSVSRRILGHSNCSVFVGKAG